MPPTSLISDNRYVKYFENIRTIQEYLVTRADKQCVPKIDNTNVDRSVAVIHATLLGCLRRAARVGARSTLWQSCRITSTNNVQQTVQQAAHMCVHRASGCLIQVARPAQRCWQSIFSVKGRHGAARTCCS